jgi:hypothetical protein
LNREKVVPHLAREIADIGIVAQAKLTTIIITTAFDLTVVETGAGMAVSSSKFLANRNGGRKAPNLVYSQRIPGKILRASNRGNIRFFQRENPTTY